MRFLTTAAVVASMSPSFQLADAQNGGGLRRKLVAKQDCTLMAAEALAIDGADHGDDDMTLECELHPDDADGYTGIIAELEVDEKQKKDLKDMIKEGAATPGMDKVKTAGMMMSGGKVHIPKGLNIKDMVKKDKDKHRRLVRTTSTMGHLPMLLVKVTDVNNKTHPDDAATMSDEVFGTGVDPYNLKTNLEECSWNQVNVTAGLTGTVEGNDPAETAIGVVEVTISLDVTVATDNDVRNAVTTAVQNKLGHGLPGPYSHVLYSKDKCYNGGCGYAAYAYINSWNSVYVENYYKRPGVLTHEIGHNMGLAHSGGINGATYTDHTCAMGNPHYSDDASQCFNAIKNWQLPWYDDSKRTIDPRTAGFSETLTFVGIGEYPEAQAGGFPVTARLVTGGLDPNGGDFFIGFNRATGPNRFNDEADNEVTVVQSNCKTGDAAVGLAYCQSFLKATLLQGESHTIVNYGGTGKTVMITADSIDITTTPGKAVVTIEQPETISPAPSPAPCDNYEDLVVRLTTDNYPGETSWTIKKDTTNPCAHKQLDPDLASPPYSSASTVQTPFQESVCRGKYVFEIKDTYGDGICCGYGSGSYEIIYGGVQVATGGAFTSSEIKYFGECETTGNPPPTALPTPAPTNLPTNPPAPTNNPTNNPTALPTFAPTSLPTTPPTSAPTPVPTTASPTSPPTLAPTPVPTNPPTNAPTAPPTLAPTPVPTTPPTPAPTQEPTTASPTNNPTPPPTSAPVATVDKFICTKNEPLPATICADGALTQAPGADSCSNPGTNDGCGKGGKVCWWAACPGDGGGPPATPPPTPAPTDGGGPPATPPPTPAPTTGGGGPNCPVCGNGDTCCAPQSCELSGKPQNRACV